MNFRLTFSVVGILIGFFSIFASLHKTHIVKSDSIFLNNLNNNKNEALNLNNSQSSGVTFDLYKDRYLVYGNFPNEELEKITQDIESGKEPNAKYKAITTTPARGIDIKPIGGVGGGAYADQDNLPKLLDYQVPGQLPGQSCYDIGKINDCRGYKEKDGSCIVCVVSSKNFNVASLDINVHGKLAAENIVRPTEPINRPWSGGGLQSPGQSGRPDVPYPYPNQGEPAPGLTEPNTLGEKCYKTREGQIWCARSPAFSLSPFRGPTIPGGPVGACGYNKQRESEQCGTDQWPDRLEIGLCRDITHSAWTPCGPGAPPLLPEETKRGLPLTTPPCITWGGCGPPCACVPLPSGNCKGNLWCVGPPGCTCCPGLACNVCCQADNYLWDSVTGWCACASK